MSHLRVPGPGKSKDLVELDHLLGCKSLWQRFQEMDPLLRGPRISVQSVDRGAAGHPASRLLLDASERIGIRLGGIVRQPRLLKPSVNLQDLREVRPIGELMLVQIGHEVGGDDAAKCEVVEVAT